MSKKAEISPDILLAGAREVTVTNRLGKSEVVKVRVVVWSEVPAFYRGINDDTELAVLVTKKPKEWVDTLDAASMDELVNVALEINHPTLAAFAERKKKLARAAVKLVLPVAAQIQAESMDLLKSLAGFASPLANLLPPSAG